MTNKFYSYDPDEGLEEHGTLESAKKSAEMSLEHWREQAGREGWHENIEHLEYGTLIPVGTMREVDRKETPESKQFDYTCDYELTATMPERKLPVVYAVVSGDGFPMDFARSRDRAEEFSKTRTNFDPLVVEYIPRAQANEDLAELIAAVRRDQSARHERAILIPEQETEWPSGYDFEALEAADVEETAAMQALESLLMKLDKSDADRKARDE